MEETRRRPLREVNIKAVPAQPWPRLSLLAFWAHGTPSLGESSHSSHTRTGSSSPAVARNRASMSDIHINCWDHGCVLESHSEHPFFFLFSAVFLQNVVGVDRSVVRINKVVVVLELDFFDRSFFKERRVDNRSTGPRTNASGWSSCVAQDDQTHI